MRGSEGAIFSLGTDKASLVGHSTTALGVRARWARQFLVRGCRAVAAAGTEISFGRLGTLVLIEVAPLRAPVRVASCSVVANAVGGDRAHKRAVAVWGAHGANGQTTDIGECSDGATSGSGQG